MDKMDNETSKVVRDGIFEAIEIQMRDSTPPETKLTYDRLISQGYPKEEVMKLIGCALSSELFTIMKEVREFDEESYVKDLRALPKLPWNDDE